MDWSDRYATPLSAVFSRQRKLEYEWAVELALLSALEQCGRVPAGSHAAIKAVIQCEWRAPSTRAVRVRCAEDSCCWVARTRTQPAR